MAVGMGRPELVSVGYSGGQLRLGSPVGGREDVAGLVSGKVVRYGGVFAGVDLEYEEVRGGVKETIILREAPAGSGAVVFRFRWILTTR